MSCLEIKKASSLHRNQAFAKLVILKLRVKEHRENATTV